MKKIDLSLGEKKVNNKIIKINKNKIKYFSLYPHEIKKSKKTICKVFKKKLNIKKNINKNLQYTLGNREGIFSSFNIINEKKKNYVLIIRPYYQIYKKLSLFYNKKIIIIEEKDIIKKNIKKSILNKTNCIFICNPNNFNGKHIKKNIISKILKITKKHNIYVINDDCYSEISKKKKNIIEINKKIKNKKIINLFSLSKRSCIPGLRSGIIFANKKLIRKFSKFKIISGTQLSCVIQILSANIWKNTKHVNKIRKDYKKITNKCLELLKKKKIRAKGGGFYISIKLKNIKEKKKIIKTLRNKKIIVCDGKIFGKKKYIRIALIENEKICKKVILKIINYINEKKKNI